MIHIILLNFYSYARIEKSTYCTTLIANPGRCKLGNGTVRKGALEHVDIRGFILRVKQIGWNRGLKPVPMSVSNYRHRDGFFEFLKSS